MPRRLARWTWLLAVDIGHVLLWLALVIALTVAGRLLEGVIH